MKRFRRRDNVTIEAVCMSVFALMGFESWAVCKASLTFGTGVFVDRLQTSLEQLFVVLMAIAARAETMFGKFLVLDLRWHDGGWKEAKSVAKWNERENETVGKDERYKLCAANMRRIARYCVSLAVYCTGILAQVARNE